MLLLLKVVLLALVAALPLQAQAQRSPTISLACLAAVSSPDPAVRREARRHADQLTAMAVRVNGKPGGWAYEREDEERNCGGPGTLDAFGDGSCNGPETTYSYQTGLAATCLARAAIASGEPSYGRLAQSIIDRWSRIGAKPPDCTDCFYVWYSDSPNDIGRYVRNTNALMGMAAAWTYRATQADDVKGLAVAIATAEAREMRERNFGYFGVDDPKFRADPERERFRVENHLPYIAKGLRDIGVNLGRPDVVQLGIAVMRSWRDCAGQDCSRFSCKRWAGRISGCDVTQIAAPCFFASDDPEFAGLCKEVVQRLRKPNDYQVWAINESR